MSTSHSTKGDTENIVIVIGRQFGGGGRSVGKKIAERLGIRYYDKELLSEAARTLGFASEIFVAADERRPSPLRTLLQGIYGIADNFHTTSIGGEKLYELQSKVIKKVSELGSCVIVGRTADYILRDNPNVVSVFLHAPLDHRVAKILERQDSSSREEAAAMAKRHDNNRENYYNYFTGRHWGAAANYHLSVDASLLSHDDIADLIISFAKAKLKKNNS